MDNPFPLLDLEAGLEDCRVILRDLDTTIQELLMETEGHYPPSGAEFCQGVARMLLVLEALAPAALRKAIADERAEADAAADRWEPSSY